LDILTFFLPTPEATRELGQAIAAGLRPGHVVCLFGDLGAGKTTLVQGIARGLGILDPVTSPTFTLIHEYRNSPPLFHIDLYRLESFELEDLGLDEYLEGEGIVCIEWPEKMSDLPKPRLEVHLSGEDGRMACLTAIGEGFEDLWKGLFHRACAGN